ncbi:MAG TPA: 23S rRNA (guanosine(2251)-2'-O)-methyltransferase RlmB [Anaerolineaceae bacterium]
MKEWITGRNPVIETLRAGRRQFFRLLLALGGEESSRLNQIRLLASQRRLKVEQVPRTQIDALGENPQGVALEVSDYPYGSLEDILGCARSRNEAPFILILDMIQNPQNLGTLLRTAEAAGVHGVIIPFRRAAGVTPAVVSASAGASEHLLVVQSNLAQAIAELKESDIWIAGLEGSPDALPYDQVRLDGALALVVGNEGEGMRPLVRQSCDYIIRLPMTGKIESLNAAVAGSIVIYEALRVRQQSAHGSRSK